MESGLEKSYRILIMGRTGSGKTHLARWLLREALPKFDELFVITASGTADDWPETTPSRVTRAYDEAYIARVARRPSKKLIVVDDQLGLIAKDEPSLIHVFTAGRHTNTSVILITQKLNGMSTAIRANTSDIYLTHTLSARELDSLHEEVATPEHKKRPAWYLFVAEMTAGWGCLRVSMEGRGARIFTTVHPAKELADFFVEPTLDTDDEGEGGGKNSAPEEKPPRKSRKPVSRSYRPYAWKTRKARTKGQ